MAYFRKTISARDLVKTLVRELAKSGRRSVAWVTPKMKFSLVVLDDEEVTESEYREVLEMELYVLIKTLLRTKPEQGLYFTLKESPFALAYTFRSKYLKGSRSLPPPSAAAASSASSGNSSHSASEGSSFRRVDLKSESSSS